MKEEIKRWEDPSLVKQAIAAWIFMFRAHCRVPDIKKITIAVQETGKVIIYQVLAWKGVDKIDEALGKIPGAGRIRELIENNPDINWSVLGII